MIYNDGFGDALPVTVPLALHDDMAREVSTPFAVSYLCGAGIDGDKLLPRTQTARERLLSTKAARTVLDRHKLTVGRALRPEEREPVRGVTECLERYDRTGKFR